MKIIIAGAGEVGFHLAKLLSYESQNITLIDSEKEALVEAGNSLDIRILHGDATSIALLDEAEIDETDLVIAVTSGEAINITICMLAKQLGAKRTIARISNNEFILKKERVDFTKFGIDELISPRSEEHTSELQSRGHLVCRLLLEKKKVIKVNFSPHTAHSISDP